MRAVAARLSVLLWALAGLCLAQAPARAQNSPQPAARCVPDDAVTLDGALAQLAQCQDVAPWLAWVGDRLQRAGRSAEAAEHLERALLIDPGLLPAQLGYLLALAGSGDTEAALAFAQDLLRRGDLPPSVEQPLSQRVAQWQRDLQAQEAAYRGWRTRVGAGLRAGYDSNLLGAPNLDSLTLILSGQPVQLPLDESYRTRGGAYLRMDANADATRQLGDLAPGLRFGVGAQLQRRVSSPLPTSNLTQGQLVAELSRATDRPAQNTPGPAGWYVSASAAQLDSATGSRYRTHGAGAGLQWRLAPWGRPCEARTGAEFQRRTLSSNPVLSGDYAGLLATLQCGEAADQAPGQARSPSKASQLQLAYGVDRAVDPLRPGGAQRQVLVRYTALAGPWLADLEFERRHDATVYSLLLGNEIRTVTRTAARLEWQTNVVWPWPAGNAAASRPAVLQLRVGGEWSSQRSNVALFGARSWGPYVALRYGG